MENLANNFNNSKLNIYKENNFDFLNKTNDKIKNRNSHIIPGKTFGTEFNEKYSIYKKKLKINNSINMYSKPKLTKIRNQILGINLNLNNNNIIGQYLSPNIDRNNNQNIIINSNNEFNNMPLSMTNQNYFRITYTEPRREADLDLNNSNNNHNHNKFGNIQELTVNLSKNRKNDINSIYKKDNIFIYSQNDFDNCRVKEYKNDSNENNSYNELNEDKNLVNEADIENENIPLKEIIIKDVSSSDNRLNVFIKYIEIPNMNKIFQRKSIYYNINLLKYFHIDSFYIPASYQKLIPSNIYYKNYCLGNKILNSNKMKFNKILSSIIEEEEKSKAAGSVNNSLSSDEEINKNKNNYSHYFIQSIKYISNLLQSIFDDKKKDSFNKFFKILKKIKNEAFLQGIINEKNSETLNKTKNEEKDNKEEINTESKE